MQSLEYPKTENLFTRNPETHKLNIGDFRLAEFGLISFWHVTEKIDGTNMRVCYDPKAQTVEIRGRTDNAQVHPHLIANMEKMFPLEKLQRQFDEYLGDQIELGTTVTIYGEGYGAGIQKGGVYSDEKNFRVFDVLYHRYTGLQSWCMPDTVGMICAQMEVPMVPVLHHNASMVDVLEFVREMKAGNIYSTTAWLDKMNKPEPEGIVARTNPYLYNERGSRVMFKLKVKDLP